MRASYAAGAQKTKRDVEQSDRVVTMALGWHPSLEWSWAALTDQDTVPPIRTHVHR